jgi:hypothetical protein
MVNIYIKNIQLKSIVDNIESFNKYPNKFFTFYRLYSPNGIYEITKDKKVYLLEPSFTEDIQTIKYGNLELLFNNKKDILIPVLSQLPVNYIISNITQYEYKINSLKLIVQGIFEKPVNANYKKKNIFDNDTKIFVPIDFYFEYNNELNHKFNNSIDKFLQDDLNVFLSHLI